MTNTHSLAIESSAHDEVIQVQNLKIAFGEKIVLDHLNFSVRAGEIFAIIGGSGCGKTTLLRTLLGLIPKTDGHIHLFQTALDESEYQQMHFIRKRIGVLFQYSALFSTLTVLDNILFPMIEHLNLPTEDSQQLGLLKMKLAGLDPACAHLMPSELSGGMQKRAGLARALALDPDILFLDEPTSGLDPQTAFQFDTLVRHLQQSLGTTMIIVSHDMDSLSRIADRVAFLGEGGILAIDTLSNLRKHPHPRIQAYFKEVE